MKISLEWIHDYVDLPQSLRVDQLMHDLTMATVEVESATSLSESLSHVVVGAVTSVSESHAVCDVGATGPITCVRGAKNIRSGGVVAVALPQSGMAAAYSGADGVVCSVGDAGLTDLFASSGAEAAIDLSGMPCTPGDSVSAVIGWNDTVLEIDNKSLTHRPDLWGHYGLARELAAIYKLPLKPLPVRTADYPPALLLGRLDTDTCNRFSALHFTTVRADPSPLWMRSRLARVGQRSFNLWVDLTNYVMLAVGQPCHAYDARKVALPMGTRPGHPGERVQLLNGQEYEIDPTVPVVNDSNGAVSLAGVMGGMSTAVTDSTTEVLLECASFDPLTVRRGSRRLGLRTEASARFEKGIDTQRVDATVDLFASLVRTIQPSAGLAGYQDTLVRPTERRPVATTLHYLEERLGAVLDPAEIVRNLTSLGFAVENEAGAIATLAPTWRSTGDISGPHDLLEEVARLRGYDSFEFVPAEVTLVRRAIDARAQFERRLRDLLTLTGGMQEVVTYPWAKTALIEAAGVDASKSPRLFVPLGPGQDTLRPSLVPNLIEVIAQNVAFLPAFRVFELGRVFPGGEAGGGRTDERLPVQPRHLAGAFVGPDATVLFRQAQGLIETLSRVAHSVAIRFVPGTTVAWADATARLGLETSAGSIGALGILTKRARRLAGIKRSEVVVFELDIDALEPLPSRENRYAAVAEHPEIDSDISVTLPEPVTWRSVQDLVAGLSPLVKQVIFVDEYRGQGVLEGHKSITLRLRLGASDRTLRSEETGDVVNEVVAALTRTFGASQRPAKS